MRLVWSVGLVFLVSLAVGYGTTHLLIARAVARGTPEYSVRMGGALGGLFAGGAVLVLLGLALLWWRNKPVQNEDAEP